MTHTLSWDVEIFLYEEGDHTTAKATLISGTGANRRRSLTATGRSSRNPEDLSVPEIGEEVAVARALRDLANQLLGVASEDIAHVTGAEVHLKH